MWYLQLQCVPGALQINMQPVDSIAATQERLWICRVTKPSRYRTHEG